MNQDISIVPEEWKQLLATIQEHDPLAVIAGGAVRDWYHGYQPRDIDVFVSHQFVLQNCPIGLTVVDGTYIISAEHDDSVSASACYTGYSLPVNIIWCSDAITPAERFNRFDFGLCKAAFNGKEIILHPEFLWDVKYGIFTLRRASNINQTIESFIRYNRLKEKYQYSLVIPHGLTLPFVPNLVF